METSTWPTIAWTSVRLLPELRSPNAWASLAATPARLRIADGARVLIGMPGTDIAMAGIDERGAYAVAAVPAAARCAAADHKFSTRLGPSVSPPV